MDAMPMKPSTPFLLRDLIRSASLLALLVVADNAAAITINQSPSVRPVEVPSKDALHGPALPKRDDLLTIDWVDAKAGRIAIGGITYVVQGSPLKIVLANGDEVASIGYLTAGMRARVKTTIDGPGINRLIVILVAP